MIHNHQDGVTINKGLAWTIVTGVAVGGLWLGTTVGGLKADLQDIGDAIQEQSAETAAITVRVRSLESSRDTSNNEISHINRQMSELRAASTEQTRLLQEILQRIPRSE